VSAHAPAILAQTGGDPARVIVATLRTHDSLASWLGLLWRKLAGFWHWYEIPDNASYEYFRLQAPLAVNLLLSWPWILPLAFLGACEVLRRPAGQVLLAHVAVGLITCVLFYNLSRFRLPVAACLLALVGPGAVGLASRWGQGSRTKVVSGLAAAIALMLVASRPWERVTPLIRLADYGVANEITEHRARRRLAAGDASGALELVERQLRTEPPELSALTPTAEAFNIPGHLARVAGAFVVLHEMAADLDGRLGQPAAAESHAGRAAMLRRIEARHRAAGLEQ
jgi:hypothetical protein